LSYRLTVRELGRVEHERFDDLDSAMRALERRARGVEGGARREAVGGRIMRRIDPVQQVVARLELSGPRRLRGGVDVRGDGSAEAFTGRLMRRLVEQGDGESPYEALRRSLSSSSSMTS
jgi:hypothetical protein